MQTADLTFVYRLSPCPVVRRNEPSLKTFVKNTNQKGRTYVYANTHVRTT